MKQILFIVCLLSAFSVNAANFSFTGNLKNNDAVQLLKFTVDSDTTVTMRTWSYAGGINTGGNTIDSGGFDPILALFDDDGFLIDQNDDGLYVGIDPVTNKDYDALITKVLEAGNYIVALAQFGHDLNGIDRLSDAFLDGSGETQFNGRTNFWALDIEGVDTASIAPSPVPVPAALWLFGPALLGLFGVKRKPA